jgi:hypothetical protein
MQKLDCEFIEKYKQKQFEMRNPVPQKVTKEAVAPVVIPMAVQEAVKKVTKEDVLVAAPVAAAPVAVQEVIKEDVPVAVQEVIKEASQEAAIVTAPVAAQNDVQVAIQMVSSLKKQDDLADDKNQPNPLELIQSALQQINYALHLLNGVKKPYSQEVMEKVESEPIVSETILPEAQIVSGAILPEAQIVSETILPEAQIVSEAILPEVQIVSGAILPIQNPIEPVPALDYISDVDVEVEVEVQKEKKKEEEFKIVMPKKLKTKKTVTTLLPVKEIKKKDEFPSLGSSFAPVKTGFWSGTVKKSLEIAKSIAHIPSPPPISSPSTNLKKSIGMVRYGPSKDDLSEEEYSDTTEEYHIQNRYGKDDDDNWE